MLSNTNSKLHADFGEDFIILKIITWAKEAHKQPLL